MNGSTEHFGTSRFARLCQIAILNVVVIAGPYSRASDIEWSGWRGAHGDGRSTCKLSTETWSADSNVAWSTSIPGEGWSSPCLLGDSVIVTTAYQSDRDQMIMSAISWGLYSDAALLVVAVAWFIVGSCRRMGSSPTAAQVITLACFLLTCGVLAACALFGGNLFDLGRHELRGWIAGEIFVSICLVAVSFGASDRPWLRIGYGIAGIIVGAVAVFASPDLYIYLQETYTRHSSPEIAIAVVTPAAFLMALGIYLVAGTVRPISRWRQRGANPRQTRDWLFWTRWSLMASIAVGFSALLIFFAQRVTIMNARPDLQMYPLYAPGLAGWVVALLVLIAVFGAAVSRMFTRSTVGSLLVVLSGTVAAAATAVFALEQMLANSAYLSYEFGSPAIVPVLGWGTTWGFGAFCILTLAACVLLEGRWPAGFDGRLGRSFFTAAAVLMALYPALLFYHVRGAYLRSVVCLDRNTGAVHWIREVARGHKTRIHRDNSCATPTAATDGTRILAWFGNEGLVCCDLSGNILWMRRDMPFASLFGVATSPIVHSGLVVIQSESSATICEGADSYVAALDAATGKTVWTIKCDGAPFDTGNCRTPIVRRVDGRDTLIIASAGDQLRGLDLASGTQLWSIRLPRIGGEPVASLASDDERIYLVGESRALAFDINKLGKNIDPVVWTQKTDGGENCSSPVACSGLLFTVNDSGLVRCFDGATGNLCWKRRLKGKYYASLVAAEDNVYFCSTKGFTTVLKAARAFTVVAQNDLADQTHATFACGDGQLFIRTRKKIWCIGTRQSGRHTKASG